MRVPVRDFEKDTGSDSLYRASAPAANFNTSIATQWRAPDKGSRLAMALRLWGDAEALDCDSRRRFFF